jgi:hypothetical protein
MHVSVGLHPAGLAIREYLAHFARAVKVAGRSGIEPEIRGLTIRRVTISPSPKIAARKIQVVEQPGTAPGSRRLQSVSAALLLAPKLKMNWRREMGSNH